jgi:hypothetical protein
MKSLFKPLSLYYLFVSQGSHASNQYIGILRGPVDSNQLANVIKHVVFKPIGLDARERGGTNHRFASFF